MTAFIVFDQTDPSLLYPTPLGYQSLYCVPKSEDKMEENDEN